MDLFLRKSEYSAFLLQVIFISVLLQHSYHSIQASEEILALLLTDLGFGLTSKFCIIMVASLSQTFYFIIILKIAVIWLVFNKHLRIIWLFFPLSNLRKYSHQYLTEWKGTIMWKLPSFSSLKIQCFFPSFSVEKVFFLLLKLIAPAALIYIPFASFKAVIASLFLFWIFKRSSICFPLHILLYSMQTVLSNQNHFLLAKPKGHFQVWFCMKFDPCWSLLPLLKSPFFSYFLWLFLPLLISQLPR